MKPSEKSIKLEAY